MSDFVTRANNDHSKPRHWLPGFTMTALVATLTVIFPVNELRASCASQEAAVQAGGRSLLATGATSRCDKKNLTPQQTAACNEYIQALDEQNKCDRREEQKKRREEQKQEAAARAAAEADTRARLKADDERRAVFLRATNDFMDALKIGMTSAEADAVEKQAFHNPAGWGGTVNTTVTGNGRTEQWVYRFSQFYGAHDLYLDFHNGELTAIQK